MALGMPDTAPELPSAGMTMIERVARAICCADREWDCEFGFTEKGCLWREYESEARAAIEAMREPTPEMIKAGNRPCLPRYIYQAMIDEALTTNPE